MCNINPELRKEIVSIIQDDFTNLLNYDVHRYTNYFYDIDGDRKRIRFIKFGHSLLVYIVNSLDEPLANSIYKEFEYRGSIWDITNDVLLFICDNI